MGALFYVEEFEHFEKAAGRSPATRKHHRRLLGKLSEWLESNGVAEDKIQPRDLIGFINFYGDRVSRSEVNNAVSAFRVYFRWIHEEGLRPDGVNPAARLKYQNVPAKPVESLTTEECQRLVHWATLKAHRERFGGLRTATLALLLLDTGLRVGEACRLRIADVDFSQARIVVRRTKIGDFRIVPLSVVMRKHLRRYLQRRARVLGKWDIESEWLFVSESGAPMSVWIADESFHRVGEKAGISRRVYPHLLRHTFATQSLLNGAPLPAVMRLGGWRRLQTVQRYTYMNDQVAAEVHVSVAVGK